jgi:hypothetical protein
MASIRRRGGANLIAIGRFVPMAMPWPYRSPSVDQDTGEEIGQCFVCVQREDVRHVPVGADDDDAAGVAVDTAQVAHVRGVVAIGAGVRNPAGQIVAGLSVSMPTV